MVSIERADYCMSKAAASMMAQNFAVRLAPNNIGVFELRPGIIETPMTAGVRDKYTPRIENGLVPAMRWANPRILDLSFCLWHAVNWRLRRETSSQSMAGYQFHRL